MKQACVAGHPPLACSNYLDLPALRRRSRQRLLVRGACAGGDAGWRDVLKHYLAGTGLGGAAKHRIALEAVQRVLPASMQLNQLGKTELRWLNRTVRLAVRQLLGRWGPEEEEQEAPPQLQPKQPAAQRARGQQLAGGGSSQQQQQRRRRQGQPGASVELSEAEWEAALADERWVSECGRRGPAGA